MKDAIQPSLLELIVLSTSTALPEGLGTYAATVVMDAPEESKAPHPAEIVLEAAATPQALRDVPALAKLPLVRLTLRLPDTSESLLLVREEDLLPALWKNYGVTLDGLLAMARVIRFEIPRQVQKDLRRERVFPDQLARKAFGHGEEIRPFVIRSLNHRITSPTGGTAYYYLGDAYYLMALLQVVQEKEFAFPLPSADCAIEFPEDGPEKAWVRFRADWNIPAEPRFPLEALPQYGKASDQILQIFRHRKEVDVLRDTRRYLLEEVYQLGDTTPPKGLLDVPARSLTPEEREKQSQLMREISENIGRGSALQDKILALYADLTAWAGKRKEGILKKQRDKERVSVELVEARAALKGREFVALPNNMDKLPAHFAAIPSGLESGLHLETDQFGSAILKVRRQSLQLAGNPQEQKPLWLPVDDLSGTEQTRLMAQVSMFFGPGGPRWLVPQGLVAVSKLYFKNGGYREEERVVRLYLNDWIDTMRPSQVARFKQKGRGEAFRGEHKPEVLFRALLGFLARLHYDQGGKAQEKYGKAWSTLKGFYVILAEGGDHRGPYVDVMLNPVLYKFVIGDGGLPYMVSNSEAMFSYDKNSLDYAPAAQMGLEQLARKIMLKTDSATLTTGKGDGIERETLANIFGILPGVNENLSHVRKRFDRVLDNLQESGVLAGWKIDGRDKTGPEAFGVKLHLTMHEDYRKAYNLTRIQTLEKALDKQLETPFAHPQKLLAKAPGGAPAKKRRGRPI